MLIQFMLQGEKVAFVDFESTGLHAASFPIEAGIAYDDENEPESWLIRPTDEWKSWGWGYQAEAVHGIPLSQIEIEGLPVGEVCKLMSRAMAGHVAVSDSILVDGAWCARLFEAAGIPMPFDFVPLDPVLEAMASAAGIPEDEAQFSFAAFRKTFPARHRAGADAKDLARGVRAAVDREFRSSLFGKDGFGIKPSLQDWAWVSDADLAAPTAAE